MISAANKVVYLWDLERMSILHKFGRSTGSIHRENIRDCKFDETALHFASAGEDKRVVVWNVKSHKAVKVLEGHKGTIFQVAFAAAGTQILSGSDDGRVLIWDAAVRCFETYPERPNRIICGGSDGKVSVWDLSVKCVVDTIAPDPEWVAEGDEQSLVEGSIMSMRISPNGRFLATGATDHTTKLWTIVSYLKDVDKVIAEQSDAASASKTLDSLIPVHDEKYNVQIDLKIFTGLRIGEVPLPMGYHADLVFTFRHEAPVLCMDFNRASDILVTGSMDSTCRLWSCRRGDLLFQINMPAPVQSLKMNPTNDDVYVICMNRILIFEIQANEKEEELPERRHELDSAVERLELETKVRTHLRRNKELMESQHRQLREASRRAANEGAMPEQIDKNHFRTEDEFGNEFGIGLNANEMNEKRPLTVPELKQLISHGLVLPSFLDTLVDQYKTIDATQLDQNMKKFNILPRQILRLIVNTKFHPKDILNALSKRTDAEFLFGQIQTGAPITSYMLNHGYRVMSDDEKGEERYTWITKISILEFSSEEEQKQQIEQRLARKKEILSSLFSGGMAGMNIQGDYIMDASGRRIPMHQLLEEDMLDDLYEDEYQWYIDNMEEEPEEDDVDFSLQKHKGTVLHFIPSEQIKLLKDFHSKREVKPIFMRQILLDRQPPHPNFNSANQLIKDNKADFDAGRYLNTRGLNVLFGDKQDDLRRRRTHNLRKGHVYSEPLVFRERGGPGNRANELREQYVVGTSMALKEATIDEYLGTLGLDDGE
ncbi:Transducin (beta)-like 3 [Phlyctochytrium planicorne]|nr:Transducin (beta)-like 3 [Phlyctochytrium planicorne]